MANRVIPTSAFTNKAKRLIKKFHTLQETLEQLEDDLIANPYLGEPYGAKIYKVKIGDESKGKGKSGGFRVLTYVIAKTNDNTLIYLLTIFDKSEESTIKKPEALALIKKCGL